MLMISVAVLSSQACVEVWQMQSVASTQQQCQQQWRVVLGCSSLRGAICGQQLGQEQHVTYSMEPSFNIILSFVFMTMFVGTLNVHCRVEP